MPNLSQIKRQRMLDFLETLRKEHTDDESIRAFTEIENHLRDKKYGLVWEEHEEAVDVKLRTHIPVLSEDTDKKITASTDGIYQDLIFDTMPVRAVSPETMLFLGFSAFQGIERERDCGPCMYMLLWLL